MPGDVVFWNTLPARSANAAGTVHFLTCKQAQTRDLRGCRSVSPTAFAIMRHRICRVKTGTGSVLGNQRRVRLARLFVFT